MYEFEDRERPGPRAAPRGHRAHGPGLRPAPADRSRGRRGTQRPRSATSAPSAGRYRQHHQLGVEALGPADPDLDVEVISLAARLLRRPRPRCRVAPAQLDGRRDLPPGLPRTAAGVPRTNVETRSAPSTVSASTPTRCGSSTASARSASRPPKTPLRSPTTSATPAAAHFDRVRDGPRRASDPLRARPPPGARASTTTPARRSSSRPTRSSRPRTGSAGEAATTDWSRCSAGPPTPGIGFGIGIERVLLACDAEGVFPVAPTPLDAFVVDVAGGSIARDLTAQLAAGRVPCGSRLRRPVDEGPVQGGGPFGCSWLR